LFQGNFLPVCYSKAQGGVKMYLKKMVYKNVGPLKEVSINMPFNDDESPKPIILVGENGSGKSTLLSNIVDSFYEMAGNAFTNVRKSDARNAYQYYKVISPTQITFGSQYLYSYIQYSDSVDYIFKCGKLSFEEFKEKCEQPPFFGSWGNKDNVKLTSITKEKAEKTFSESVFAYFGPNRYEKPNWMGEKYYDLSDYEHPYTTPHYNGTLDNPISVNNVTATNLQWLLDLIVDSRADIYYDSEGFHLTHFPSGNINNYIALGDCRKQIERIMSQIMKQEVYFDLNVRNNSGSRFNIKKVSNNELITPQLDALSTGEIALFNMFSTIVKYADKLEINNSIHLENITGIVIIDEIELHLHGSMQKEVLPKLIKLFPKVQFVITTHSPLFLLGMKNEFDDDGFEIYQLPTGTQITAESFSEFQRAFDYMTETQHYQKEVQKTIQDATNTKPLIITEGSTDWRHIKAAYNALSFKSENESLFSDMDFELYEYDPTGDKYKDSPLQMEMGWSTLCTICESLSKIKRNQKIIFIADDDEPNATKKLKSSTNRYKNWGNNVYSILLPIPQHRTETPLISIEHYYTDDEIKTEVSIGGISRRLFMGNEFDKRGINSIHCLNCDRKEKCGKDKINIIDGTSGERITHFDNADVNLALPKMEFAQRILNKEPPFDNFNFDSFIELFEIIKEILELPLV
jgi:predicted ATPase